MMVYKFRHPGLVPRGADPDAVVEELQGIHRQHGKLTADLVVDTVAEDAKSSLRPWFTWDEELGMRKLHVIEARDLIRSVVVTQIVPGHTEPTRVFVRIHNEDIQASYEHVQTVLKTPDRRAELIRSVELEKRRFDEKFSELLTLLSLVPMNGDGSES